MPARFVGVARSRHDHSRSHCRMRVLPELPYPHWSRSGRSRRREGCRDRTATKAHCRLRFRPIRNLDGRPNPHARADKRDDREVQMPDPERLTLSATESPALFGASPYLTRWMLYRKFVHGDNIEKPADERMNWGKLMQPIIIEQVARERGLEVVPNDDTYVRRGLLGCARDATIIAPGIGPGALEIKCVFDYRVWMTKWNGGKTVPREIEIQLQQQMYVGNGEGDSTSKSILVNSYNWGLIAVWVCADLYYFERKPITDLWTELERKAIGFFSDVRRKREPDPFGTAVELPL